jgi:hypothetical protein
MLRRLLIVVIALMMSAAAMAEKKKPAGISVESDAKALKAVLFAQMTSLGYSLQSDKKDRVTYTRELRLEDFPTTAMTQRTYSDPPRQAVTFRLKPQGNKLEVTASMEAQYRDNLGLTRTVDMTQDTVLKPQIQGMLDNVNAAFLASAERRKTTKPGEVAKDEKPQD